MDNVNDSVSVQYYFADDEYITWFECSNCKCNRIIFKSNYCPKCGSKDYFKSKSNRELKPNGRGVRKIKTFTCLKCGHKYDYE